MHLASCISHVRRVLDSSPCFINFKLKFACSENKRFVIFRFNKKSFLRDEKVKIVRF